MQRKGNREKISLLHSLDPFGGSLAECTDATQLADASDLVSYLVLQISFFPAKQFKAHKAL